MSLPHPSQQRGLGLIHLAVILAVVALATLTGLRLIPSLVRESRVASEARNIGMLIANVRNTYRGRYAALSNAAVIRLGLAPADLTRGGVLATQWGGMNIMPSSLAGSPPNTAMVIAFNIPPKDCGPLATSLAPLVDAIKVNHAADRWIKTPVAPNPDSWRAAAVCDDILIRDLPTRIIYLYAS